MITVKMGQKDSPYIRELERDPSKKVPRTPEVHHGEASLTRSLAGKAYSRRMAASSEPRRHKKKYAICICVLPPLRERTREKSACR
jgi:hypothetical protein